MVRAAAKNHPSVAIVTSPDRYADVLAAVAGGGFTLEERKRLAAEAFQHTASYDVAVASWMGNVLTDTSEGTGFPAWTGATWEKAAVLRYGENPHQPAALYRHWRGGLAAAEQLHGKEMSYNNYVDTDAARRAANDFERAGGGDHQARQPVRASRSAPTSPRPTCKANACDPTSAFGGVIAVNRPVSVAMAEAMRETFTEVIVAPAYEDGAVEVLQALPRGGKNIRILLCPADQHPDPVEFRGISGGVLMQRVDHVDAPGDDPSTWTLATGEAADEPRCSPTWPSPGRRAGR